MKRSVCITGQSIINTFIISTSRCNNPLLTTHWAKLVSDHMRLVEPLFNAVNMKAMTTST